MKQLILTFFAFCLLSNLSFAQENLASQVDINPDELNSLISKLVVAKRQKMSYQQYLMYQQIQMHQKRIQYKTKRNKNQKTANTTPSTNLKNQRFDKIAKMLSNLEKNQQSPKSRTSDISRKELYKMKMDILDEIATLKEDIDEIPVASNNEPIVIKAPANKDEHVELYEQLAKSMNDMNQSIRVMEKKIANASSSNSDNSKLEKQVRELSDDMQKLEKKIGSFNNNTNSKDFSKELNDIKQMIAKIDKSKSTHTKETIQTNTISNNNNTNYNYLTEAIKGREISQILFANASHALTEEAKNTIRNIANLMKQHDRLDVLIAGYTSSQGSLLYNQELSLQRTESVKRFLMELGVHATHIFSEYHGIDYNAADDSNARRVEVKILVRK